MQYEVNTDGSGLEPVAVENVLKDSLETWDSETSFELFASPIVLTTEQNPGENDGKNIVV